MRARWALVLTAMMFLWTGTSRASGETPLLVHAPTMNKTQIVFVYGGYLWSVPREGARPGS